MFLLSDKYYYYSWFEIEHKPTPVPDSITMLTQLKELVLRECYFDG